MSRVVRLVLAVLASFAAAAPVAAEDWPAVNRRLFAGRTENPKVLAKRAYVWGMPLVEAGKMVDRFAATSPLNRFQHLRRLSGPEMRAGVGPNNDTLYSLAWIDVSDGPLILQAPDFGDRYYTFSINQADSGAEQSLGQRTHGGQLPPLFLHAIGDGLRAPAGMVDVPIRLRYANLAGRILVRSEREYPMVHALQDAIRLVRWSDYKAGRIVPAPPPAHPPVRVAPDGSLADKDAAFLAELGHVLQRLPASATRRGPNGFLRPLGIDRAAGFAPAHIPSAEWPAIRAGLAEGRELVRQRSLHLGTQAQGWSTNTLGPRFADDYLLRAGVAKDQIFVALPEEALYPIARVDAKGQPLDGHKTYRLHFPPGRLPPVDAFWSITVYDDSGFMVPNAINRYSIGDRTNDLVPDPDGGLSILLSHSVPDGATNWLPVPSAPFYLMMRLYRPRTEALSGPWDPPAIAPLGEHGRD